MVAPALNRASSLNCLLHQLEDSSSFSDTTLGESLTMPLKKGKISEVFVGKPVASSKLSMFSPPTIVGTNKSKSSADMLGNDTRGLALLIIRVELAPKRKLGLAVVVLFVLFGHPQLNIIHSTSESGFNCYSFLTSYQLCSRSSRCLSKLLP